MANHLKSLATKDWIHPQFLLFPFHHCRVNLFLWLLCIRGRFWFWNPCFLNYLFLLALVTHFVKLLSKWWSPFILNFLYHSGSTWSLDVNSILKFCGDINFNEHTGIGYP